MAKKRRKEEVEAEKYQWTPPDFDEKSFLRTDIKGTKVLMVAALLGVILGIVAYALTGVAAWLGLIVILVGAVALKKLLPFFRVDVEGVKNTTIAGNAVMLFFIAMAVWIVALNPPFSDHYPPQISNNQVYVQHLGGNWTTYPQQNPTIHVGDNVRVVAKVVDNGKLSSVQVEITGLTTGYVEMRSDIVPGNYAYEIDSVGPVGTYSYSLKAIDSAGNTNTVAGSFIVSA